MFLTERVSICPPFILPMKPISKYRWHYPNRNGPGNPIDNLKKVLGLWREMVTGEEPCGCMLGNSVAELGLEHAVVGKLLEENISLIEDLIETFFLVLFDRSV
jgi:hypothetical protein